MNINNKNNKPKKHSQKTHKKFLLSPILVMIGAYLLIAVTIMLIIAPYVIHSIEYTVWRLPSETAIIIFVATLLISITMLTLFVSIYSKEKSKYTDSINNADFQSNIQTYGNYSNERKYLEEKIEELTMRLTQTENKWKDMNHLVLAANDKNSDNSGQIYSDAFLKEFGIDISNVKLENDLVFVLTPADKEFVKDYITVKSTCSNIKLRTLRGDEQDLSYTKNSILGHILEYIVKSRIIIANISNRNPNVYYELGIAHMLGKPSILICRKNTEVPFDLQQKYIVFYENEEELSEKLNDALLNMLTV